MPSADTSKYKLLGIPVRRLNSNGFIYSVDIEIFCNKQRLQRNQRLLTANQFFGLPSVKDALAEMSSLLVFDPINFIRGKGKGRYIHPYVAVAMALWFDKLLVPKASTWFMGELSHDYKNEALLSRLFLYMDNPLNLINLILKIRDRVRRLCGIDNNCVAPWEVADDRQLQLRDKLNDVFSVLLTVLPPMDALDKTVEIVSEQYPHIISADKTASGFFGKPSHYVYFISNGVHTKVGVSKNINKRLKTLQTSNPQQLTLYDKLPCSSLMSAMVLESKLHKMLKTERSDALNEWFDVTPEHAFVLGKELQQEMATKPIKRRILKKVSK